eukprot:13310944-Alexandrium_andersonii.AAC.1
MGARNGSAANIGTGETARQAAYIETTLRAARARFDALPLPFFLKLVLRVRGAHAVAQTAPLGQTAPLYRPTVYSAQRCALRT